MENNAKRIKTISSLENATIENLNKQLKQKAASAPQYDPFTVTGKQLWLVTWAFLWGWPK